MTDSRTPREASGPPQLLTAKETAQLLRVHPKTLYRLARLRSNPLPSIRVGGRLKFDPSDVTSWIRQRREG